MKAHSLTGHGISAEKGILRNFTGELKDVHARIKTTEVSSDEYAALLLHAQELTKLLKDLKSQVIDYNQQVKEARDVNYRVSRDLKATEEEKDEA